jgi:hypothetical protein
MFAGHLNARHVDVGNAGWQAGRSSTAEGTTHCTHKHPGLVS